ncbi:zinc finger protein 2 homolog [Harmonia axyridis]|uniref:zinc finger protein 2 homolog n=1 Tax=Harmonia axyridis TaxID=115357 RepID=UPI001E2752E6|nr:zinc finger protein 2 homolog [Harmonia axyridis]
MEVKSEASAVFDVNNICRACLSDKGEMRSVFLTIDNPGTGRAMVIAEMMMGFCSVQVENNDGLPSTVCLQCFHNINTAFSFKQLCEQSDTNLRQYLGKPLQKNLNKDEDSQKNDFTSTLFLDGFGIYSSSGESDDDYKDDFPLLEQPLTNNPNDEKIIAQKQLLKAAKMQKSKISKKILSRNGGTKAAGVGGKKIKRIIHQCNACKKTFINLKSFRKHLRTHIEDRPFKCKLCPRGFTEENYLNNHMRTHMPDDQKPHECNVCNKRFIHATLLNKHMLKHNGEKPFVCEICNKGCYAENSLLKHMKIHEKKEGDPALLKHICDYCKLEFPDNDSLSVHIKQHTGDRPFVCNTCGKCFPQRFNLELHLRTHTGERPFQCEVCKNGYVSKASLKIHMRTHTNERPFVCDFCGKAFRQSGDLTSHKRLHGTEKPIECSVCQKRFTTVMKLKYHMRNHTGERPYVCTVCGRGFTVNTILLRHMRVHSGERPYVCVTCGKAFSQSSTLNTHMKVHAPSQSSKYQETLDQRMPKFNENNDQKFQQPQIQQLPQPQQTMPTDHNRLMQHDGTCRRIMQQEVPRMMAADNSRMIPDGSHILTDTRGLLPDNSSILTNDGRRILINVCDQNRLLVNDNTRLMANDTRLLSSVNIADNGNRLLGNDGRLMNADNSRNMALDNSRILQDKYLTTYDPYHRGHL